MIVVADASPLRYLVLIESAEILPALYGRITTSAAVMKELSQPETPESVRQWATSARPLWLETRSPSHAPVGFPVVLGIGERDAISLAEELRADALLIDDRAGRREAQRRGVPLLGTLGVIDAAAQHGLIDLPAVMARLRQTNFRVDERLFKLILDRHAARR